MPRKRTALIGEITYATLKNGLRGIAVGEESYFLELEYHAESLTFRARLRDIEGDGRILSTWASMNDVADLRNGRNCEGLRNVLANEFTNAKAIMEQVLVQIDVHRKQWMPTVELSELSQTEQTQVPTTVIPPYEAEVNAEVERLLALDNQLFGLRAHLNNIIVGEDVKKTAITILLLGSRYNPEVVKDMKAIILLKGKEGTGKTKVMTELCSPYSVKDIGRMSAHALDYMNMSGFDILMLKELGELDAEEQGVSMLKFMSTEDQGYAVEVTEKDEGSGRFTTHTYKIPSMTVISSTTKLFLDKQFERRAWIFNTDETVAQTKRILNFKANIQVQNNEKRLGQRLATDYEFSKAVLKRFITEIPRANVMLPCPFALKDILGSETLARHGIDKLYMFMRLYGVLNLRRIIQLSDDEYVLTPSVILEAIQLIRATLKNMMHSLEQREIDVLIACRRIEKFHTGDTISKSDRDELVKLTGFADRTLRAVFQSLEGHSYVSSTTVGREKVHTLLCFIGENGEIESENADILVLTESLLEEMKKETLERFGSYLSTRFSAEDIEKFMIIPDNILDMSENIITKTETVSAPKPNRQIQSKAKSISDYSTEKEDTVIPNDTELSQTLPESPIESKILDVASIVENPTVQETVEEKRARELSDVLPEDARVCGHCLTFRKKSCSITRLSSDMKFDCVSPLNKYAEDCPSYVDRKKFTQGAADVLNGNYGGS
jgi:hypothetical protein